MLRNCLKALSVYPFIYLHAITAMAIRTIIPKVCHNIIVSFIFNFIYSPIYNVFSISSTLDITKSSDAEFASDKKLVIASFLFSP